tara:strand:- start:162 stop:812 length:651 start_codon:yes stop_codon:yes gene_type:complete
MPEIDDADGSQPHLKGDKKMPKAPKEKLESACNHSPKGEECPVHGTKDCSTVKEEAPKGKKYARMVKHIKKNYPKDKEGIAYATAWKHKNSTSMEEKTCGKGEYFCRDEQKCKPIPKGHHVMKDGTLMKGETHKEGAAWTRKAGKNKEGGLNEKGRKSYERENPGSDLKAPSKKKGNKRRASFCARMKGMKKKLTSKKTANDPDSRINKSLRAWNC